MPDYSIYFKQVIYADKDGGAILEKDELWYPFRFFDDGEIDILSQDGQIKPSIAYLMYKKIYT